MYEELFNQHSSFNASAENTSFSFDSTFSQNFSSNMITPSIKEYNDGISIDFGGSPYYVEYHDANVQIWRDKDGRIVSIDVVYEDDSK